MGKEKASAAVQQAAEKPADSCATCRFSRGVAGRANLECLRYPTALNKNAADWCGEFAPAKA